MIWIKEAEVLCLCISTALVHIYIKLNIFQPLKGLSEQHIFFNKDASILVQDMKHNKSPPNGIEVVLQIAFRLSFYPVLEHLDDLVYLISCFLLKESHVVF